MISVLEIHLLQNFSHFFSKTLTCLSDQLVNPLNLWTASLVHFDLLFRNWWWQDLWWKEPFHLHFPENKKKLLRCWDCKKKAVLPCLADRLFREKSLIFNRANTRYSTTLVSWIIGLFIIRVLCGAIFENINVLEIIDCNKSPGSICLGNIINVLDIINVLYI